MEKHEKKVDVTSKKIYTLTRFQRSALISQRTKEIAEGDDPRLSRSEILRLNLTESSDIARAEVDLNKCPSVIRITHSDGSFEDVRASQCISLLPRGGLVAQHPSIMS